MPQITRLPEPRFENPPKQPWDWVRDWLEAAQNAGQIEPTAMNLATVDADGRPSNRTVLFKGWHAGMPCFYTNHEGRKGQELLEQGWASICFWWDRLDRQIRMEGRVRQLPTEVSDAYFASRGRRSQIGAWASAQSYPIDSRADLEARFRSVEMHYDGQSVPRPPHWGGFGLKVDRVELWQGQNDRFHDRLQYTLHADEKWLAERLQP